MTYSRVSDLGGLGAADIPAGWRDPHARFLVAGLSARIPERGAVSPEAKT